MDSEMPCLIKFVKDLMLNISTQVLRLKICNLPYISYTRTKLIMFISAYKD
jgi:hypothetical protein